MSIVKLAILIAGVGLAAAFAMAPANAAAQTIWLTTPVGKLKVETFGSAHLGPHPNLVVVLHGDLDHPGYHDRFARAAADVLDDTVVAAVLRPGYVDAEGDRSDGRRGAKTADNYTPEIVNALTNAVDQLKHRFGATRVTLVGHSGGAALSADVLEQHPDTASRAVLVSCPCDLGPFRLHMALKQLSPAWLWPVRSLSPTADAGRLSNRNTILILTGAEDDVAPPRLAAAFVKAAGRAGAKVCFALVPGQGHNMLLEPAIMAALVRFEADAPASH